MLKQRAGKHMEPAATGKECRKYCAALLMTLGITLALPIGAAPATAGQAQAQYGAAIRIDPGLVRKSRQQRTSNAWIQATRPATVAAATRPRVLPLAGGGICVRRETSAGRFRWICR